MPKGAKHKRSQDQAHLADEIAKGVGPQGRRRGPAPTRPGETREERQRLAARARRAKAKAAREQAEAIESPRPPEPQGEPESIAAEVRGPGPPKVEPELVEPGPTTEDGSPVSYLWELTRSRYPAGTRKFVDALVAHQKLELDDLVWLEFAEHAEASTRRHIRGVESAMLQSRKQMARLLVARGPIGGVNDVPVRVPEGMDLDSLTRPLDDGDDVLAEPTAADLPERYR